MSASLILTMSCPDQVGVVAAVSGFIAEHGGWICDSSQHSDPSGYFFMRTEMRADSLPFDTAGFEQQFRPIAERYQMNWRVVDTLIPPRVVILVSRMDHCLSDLLYRWRNQDFSFDIACVISNHDTLRGLVEWHEIPFYHVPVEADRKAAAFEQVERLFQDHRGDVMVLARYMQIVPPSLCEHYPGRIINIHHSFLPSFVGARPYHQAFERGVKLVGATCHYVTAELDAGPIIEQDVIRVDHGHSVDDMVRLGKDVEKTVLARGLRYHVQERIVPHGSRTVILA